MDPVKSTKKRYVFGKHSKKPWNVDIPKKKVLQMNSRYITMTHKE